MYLVSMDSAGPYPKNVQARRVILGIFRKPSIRYRPIVKIELSVLPYSEVSHDL